MSAIDIIILIIFAVAAFFGFMKGAVRQLGSFAGVIGGYIAARMFGEPVGAMFLSPDGAADSSISAPMASVLGSIIVFVAVFVGFLIVARLLRGFIGMTGLGMLDRIAGVVVSLLKWFLAVSIVLNLWRLIAPGSAVFSSSHLAGGDLFTYILGLFPWLMGVAGYN